MPVGESGGLYYVTTTSGLDFGFLISRHKFSRASSVRSFCREYSIELLT